MRHITLTVFLLGLGEHKILSGELTKDCEAFAACKPVQIRQKETVILKTPAKTCKELSKQRLSASVQFAHI